MKPYIAALFCASSALALTSCGPSSSATDPTRVPPTTQFRISRVLKIGSGDEPMMTLAEGLERPEGIAFEQGGDNLVVMEVGARRITRIEPSGAKTVLAQNLPVGLSDGPSLFRGLAVGTTATTIYFSSDVDNTIYRLTPKQRN